MNKEPSDNIDIERDKKWKKSGGQQFNTTRGQGNKDLFFISLAKYALQSPEGQKEKKEKINKQTTKEDT